MGHKKSIVRETVDRLSGFAAYGQSKHADKLASPDHKPAPEKIYSYSTMGNYIDAFARFAKWARAEHGCKTLDEAHQYTGEYLQYRMDKGLSAWTVRRDAAALAKVYQCQTTDLGATLPRRERADITQHRSKETWRGHFSENRNRALVDTAKATGLRRHEMAALRPQDVYKDASGRVIVQVIDGKGGKDRLVTAINDAPLKAAEAAKAAGQERIFAHIPNRTPLHAYRADYAAAYYNSIARDPAALRGHDVYICRGHDAQTGQRFDRAAMREASEMLGHGRVSVMVPYLRGCI